MGEEGGFGGGVGVKNRDPTRPRSDSCHRSQFSLFNSLNKGHKRGWRNNRIVLISGARFV